MCKKNACIRCGIDTAVRRVRFFVKRRHAFLCLPCIEALNGSAGALAWLEKSNVLNSEKFFFPTINDKNRQLNKRVVLE